MKRKDEARESHTKLQAFPPSNDSYLQTSQTGPLPPAPSPLKHPSQPPSSLPPPPPPPTIQSFTSSNIIRVIHPPPSPRPKKDHQVIGRHPSLLILIHIMFLPVSQPASEFLVLLQVRPLAPNPQSSDRKCVARQLAIQGGELVPSDPVFYHEVVRSRKDMAAVSQTVAKALHWEAVREPDVW